MEEVAGPRTLLARQALVHGAVALLLAWSVIALNQRTGHAQTPALAATWAFLAGLGLSHIVHEWCHFLGGRLGGARLVLRPRIQPLFFDFDFEVGSAAQFLRLSAGGLAGNLLLLGAAAVLLYPQQLPGVSFIAAVAGQLVFVLILELPVSLRVRQGQAPMAALTAHFGQGGPLFLRAFLAGAATAIAVLMFA